jgi:ectoine hydroxylase-related dioxygenase (phytanoyl-CoA dioxygenase family)
VPLSHLTRLRAPHPDIVLGHPLLQQVTGPKGSLFLWNAGIFHSAMPNRSSQVRVGLNISYYPPWFNLYSEGGHQPVWPETYARMPPGMRSLIGHRRGHSRSEVYEGA